MSTWGNAIYREIPAITVQGAEEGCATRPRRCKFGLALKRHMPWSSGSGRTHSDEGLPQGGTQEVRRPPVPAGGLSRCGGGGIRTHGALKRLTRVGAGRLSPLGHASATWARQSATPEWEVALHVSYGDVAGVEGVLRVRYDTPPVAWAALSRPGRYLTSRHASCRERSRTM